MKRIFAIGLCLLFSSGAYAQTVAPSGQTPLARMQEDEVSGSAHQTIENAKKQPDGKKEEKNAGSAHKRQGEEQKNKVKQDSQVKEKNSPQP